MPPATVHQLRAHDRRRGAPRSAPPPGDDAGPEAVRDWLREALDRGDGHGPFSPTRLAEAAGVAHSTITRALDPERPSAPSLRTLGRVARVAGMALPDAANPWVPVVSAAVWARFGLEAAKRAPQGRQPAVPGLTDGCVGAVVSGSCSVAGVLPGDTALVRAGERPRHGEPVAVALPDGTMCVLRFGQGPLPGLGAKLLGPVAEVRRELAPAAAREA